MAQQSRITGEEAFVLHTYPYRETSLIVELFTRQFGRVSAVAKGAKRSSSNMKTSLQAFRPLHVSWGGRSELKTLFDAEWRAGTFPPTGNALMSAFYMNELLLKLLIREDPHENLFSVYEGAIKALGVNAPSIEKILRRFERQLLTELGYGMTLTQDVRNNESVVPNALYTYVIGRGAVRINQGDDVEFKITGKALVDIENDALDDPRTLAQYKALMRLVISHHLGRKTLHTRRLFTDLQDEQFIHDKT